MSEIYGPGLAPLSRGTRLRACSLKTSTVSLFGTDLDGSIETFDLWVTWLRQDSLARRKSAQLKSDFGLSSWPFATAGAENVDRGTDATTIRESQREGAGQNLAVSARLWSGPAAQNSKGPCEHGEGGPNLQTQTANWASIRASDGEKGGPNMRDGAGSLHLPSEAAQWHAPDTVPDAPNKGSNCKDVVPGLGNQAKGFRSHLQGRDWVELACSLRLEDFSSATLELLGDAIRPSSPKPSSGASSSDKTSTSRRRLNPNFVEWLMGWPIGLTASGPAETEFTRWLRLSRSALFGLISMPGRAAE